MPLLSPGARLGSYEILSAIGAGGMGEVYRAADTKLGREVAIKVLPQEFSRDPERLARFEREARMLASLNHPNIAAIYGLEQSDGKPFLVLELVPGPTLAETLAAGRLEAPEALRIAVQIAEALEAAHEKAIVHRDLKPANIKVTPEGKVKVLDFGLAKAFAGEPAETDPSRSPTLTMGTRAGVILGTAAYMSPEQARGKPLDKRTDIWAFGCVLYEALAGRQTFTGETVSHIIVAVCEREPDWQALPTTTTAKIRDLLRRCLQKDLSRRLRDVADARLEIEEALSAGASAAVSTPRAVYGQWRRAVLWGLSGVLAGALVAGLAVWKLSPPAAPTRAHLSITLPPAEPLAIGDMPAVSLSPDGTKLVYVARSGGTTKLYLRAMDQFEPKPIDGTDGANGPFFSPDGQWVGFFADKKLKKIPTTGGPGLTICDASEPTGASWGPQDAIFLNPNWGEGLARVSAAGGKPETVTRPDPSKGEIGHSWPEVLPGGQAVLFTAGRSSSLENASIDALFLKTGQRRTLIVGGNGAHYLPTGHLLYARSGVLLAAPFDLARLAVTGPAVPVLEGVAVYSTSGTAQFSVSADGTLAYVPGGMLFSERSLVWVDRKGAAQPITELRRPFEDMNLSPDGRRLALTIEGPAWNIWIYELARGTLTRLTFEQDNRDPLWTPDGKRVVYTSWRDGRYGLFWKAADGSGPEERLTNSEYVQRANSWSPDGSVLVFSDQRPGSGTDLWTLEGARGERKTQPLLQTKFTENRVVFSPDGHWLAYVSNESGREEVYVQAYPGPGGKWQISPDGGSRPAWAPNGRELFYRNGDKMMAVPIETKPAFSAGSPRMLFEGRYWESGHDYHVTPSGDRFVFIKEAEQKAAPTQINVVQNWFEELKQRTAGKR